MVYALRLSLYAIFSIPFAHCTNILAFFVGDLQSTLLSMRDCAYESSVALSAFGSVSRNHTALTSECGSMLEEVTECIYEALDLICCDCVVSNISGFVVRMFLQKEIRKS